MMNVLYILCVDNVFTFDFASIVVVDFKNSDDPTLANPPFNNKKRISRIPQQSLARAFFCFVLISHSSGLLAVQGLLCY